MSDEHLPAESNAVRLDQIASNTVDALNDALAVISQRHPETFQWEFYEGALVAMLCTRRVIDAHEEWMPVLFNCDAVQPQTAAIARTRTRISTTPQTLPTLGTRQRKAVLVVARLIQAEHCCGTFRLLFFTSSK